MMLLLIKTTFLLFIDDIDSGNSNINEELLKELLSLLLKFNLKLFSKIEAAKYIGVSRATFDNYINKGLIPKGKKIQGFKELCWYKLDLDEFINNK